MKLRVLSSYLRCCLRFKKYCTDSEIRYTKTFFRKSFSQATHKFVSYQQLRDYFILTECHKKLSFSFFALITKSTPQFNP